MFNECLIDDVRNLPPCACAVSNDGFWTLNASSFKIFLKSPFLDTNLKKSISLGELTTIWL